MNTSQANQPKLPDHVHVFDVEGHEQYKPLLLKSIEEMVEKNNIEPNGKGYLYDFPLDEPRTYQKLFEQVTYPYVTEIGELYGLGLEKLQRLWFQQYTQNTDFGWHQHSGHWAVVYYLELPEISEATEFLNYDMQLKEGQLIFFPTFLVHRSPIIKSNTRKTIIATNVSYKVDRELIEKYGEESFKH